MQYHYTNEKNVLFCISLLKAYGVKKIVVSPGATNVTFVASVQRDSYFELYSSVDERSAAYIACGLAAESGGPVALSCTGATASRNYYPGITEAYYRKLPVLAITSTRDVSKIGHLHDQQMDRSVQPKDTVKCSVQIQTIKDATDEWDVMIKLNKAMQALTRNGGGPAHINLTTTYSRDYSVLELPKVRKIGHFTIFDELPPMEQKKIAIYVGTHAKWTKRLTDAVDKFCQSHNAVVFSEPCSGYKGKYRVFYFMAGNQPVPDDNKCPDLLIHIGEVSAFPDTFSGCTEVWRVNEDGEIRDKLKKLTNVFEMPEYAFFEHYCIDTVGDDSYLTACKKRNEELQKMIPELPFSNVWIAQQMHDSIPSGAVLHLGILSSLRAWTLMGTPANIDINCNEGGFGIDGNMSSLLGASLVHPDKLYFGIIGDLSFFYDMNVVGNRHLRSNVRIMIINNGRGNEFRLYTNPARMFGAETDEYISAARHFGNKSPLVIKHYAEDLGFEYFSAVNKEEFHRHCQRFLTSEMTGKPMIFEVFTDAEDENTALYTVNNLDQSSKDKLKDKIKGIVGEDTIKSLKAFIKK